MNSETAWLASQEVLYRETRESELVGIRELLDQHRDRVLTIRIGAPTNVSKVFT